MRRSIAPKVRRTAPIAKRTAALACVFALCTAFPHSAVAAKWLDYIRNYDMNDYALGVATTVTESPYVGGANSVFTYPYLTSFRSDMLTDDWLVLSDGNLGFRVIRDSGWMFGAIGRLNTLGFGVDTSDALAGMEHKQWSIEIAPLVGYRGWPVQFQLRPYWEVTGRHGGFNTELLASWPVEHARGWITPEFRVSHKSADYVDYYFGVRDSEAVPGRPAYSPGASTNIGARLHWGYQLSENWLASGRLTYEWLADEIQDSPIVDEETLWSVNLGIAYNADIFRASGREDTLNIKPGFQLFVGVLRDSVDTEVRRDRGDGTVVPPVDAEEDLKFQDDATIGQIAAIWRINRFHRLNFDYFDLFRETGGILAEDLEFGDDVFPAGSEIKAKIESRLASASYSYLLMSDSQKELGVSAGVHYSSFRFRVEAESTGQDERVELSAPLPVIGAHGSLQFGQRTALGLRLLLYRMEVDHLKGRLDHVHLGLEHTFRNRLSLGVGYQLYDMRLESDKEDINGTIRIRHQGPFLFLGANFF